MSHSVDGLAQRKLPEHRPHMAKARLHERAETPDVRREVGRAIQRAARLAGWSLKELAASVDRDPRQVSRWLTGDERPHLDALFAVDALRSPLVQALGELARAEVCVTITLRRSA